MTLLAPSRAHHAALVELTGHDALAFANAQFASDVASLQVADAQWSCWLDAQGRVRHVFLLAHVEAHRLLCWLPLGDASTMARELARYVLRSRVAVHAIDDARLLAEPASESPSARVGTDGADLLVAAPLLSSWRLRFARPTSEEQPRVDGLPAGLAVSAVEAGLAWLADALAGQFTSAALDLARIGATRLDKGCYPGQEIVARLHYRGGNKRHLMRLHLVDVNVPAPGTRVVRIDEGATTDHGRVLYGAPLDEQSVIVLAVVDEGSTNPLQLQLATGQHVVTTSTQFTMAC